MIANLLPDFLIIGAAKSGTTSLFYQLRDHPEIFCPPVKELNFFSQGDEGLRPGSGPGDPQATIWVDSVDSYVGQFQEKQEHQVAGEASVSYLYSPVSARNIKQIVPNARLIMVLRDPVERAWSNYCHMVRDGRESLDFKEALSQEDERIEADWEFSWHYKNLGLYGGQLSRFLDHFPRERLKVFLFRELKADTAGVVQRIFRFLGVDPAYETEVQNRHNRSGAVRSQLLARLINRPNVLTNVVRKVIPLSIGHRIMETLRTLNMEGKPSMPLETRSQLENFYAADIERTERLLDIDLSHWKRHT